MQIVYVDKFGGPEELTLIDEPDPVPAAGQILVDVKSSGINYADVIAVGGHYPGVTSAPFYPGLEVAGVVSAIGDGVSGFSVGERVTAFIPAKGYATKAVVDAATAVKIPDSLGLSEATALLVQGLTAYFLLKHGEVGPGKSVLIASASGGLGSLAIQFAKLKGAGTIIGLASKSKHERVKSLGADFAVDYTQPGWSKEVLSDTDGKGVSIYLDSGGDFEGEGFDALGDESHWLIFGGMSNTGKPLAAQKIGPMISKGITLRGYTLYSDIKNVGPALGEMLGWAAAGKLRIDVESFPLADVIKAHVAIANRQTSGKVVLLP